MDELENEKRLTGLEIRQDNLEKNMDKVLVAIEDTNKNVQELVYCTKQNAQDIRELKTDAQKGNININDILKGIAIGIVVAVITCVVYKTTGLKI